MNPIPHNHQMQRGRRRSLPLTFLLSLAAAAILFLLLSYRHSSLPLFARPDPSVTLHLTPRRNPNSIIPSNFTFTFTVKVLAFDRIDSLRRCLRSLSAADYAGDRVDLHVYVDHFGDIVPMNGSDLVDRKLEVSHQILEFVDGFGWRHGEKLVHYRTGNAGLQAQWLEAWWPSSDDEFVFVVEDDLEVSPLYYRYLRGLIAKYYYDPENFSPLIYGASLQRPRFVPGKHGNKLQLDSDTHLFLYQLVGTWGQLLFPKPWKEFRLWYDAHKTKGIKPILQGMVTTGWYKRMGERIWTPWFIKFIHSHGYYNIYTNLSGERALSISHRDAGVNYRKSAGPDSFLVDESSAEFDLWELQPLRNLKWYDFCFREVHPERVVRSLEELRSVLYSFQKEKPVLLISLHRTAQSIARNLLCHLERLNIRNYIFTGNGTNSELLIDLARKGHVVIDTDRLISSIRGYKLSGLQHSEVELVKEVLVKAYFIKKSLECGYNSWVVEGNMIPVSDAISERTGTSHEFFSTIDAELFFAKNSPISVKIWNDELIDKMARVATSLTVSGSALDNHRHFVYLATNALEEKNSASVQRDDGLSIGVRLGNSPVNKTLESGKMMVFWSPRPLDSLQRELESVGLWLIDGDSSCAAVFCHQS